MNLKKCSQRAFLKYIVKTGTAESLFVGMLAIIAGAHVVIFQNTSNYAGMFQWMPPAVWSLLFSTYGILKITLADRSIFPGLEAIVSTAGIWLWSTLLISAIYFDCFHIRDVSLVAPVIFEVLSLALALRDSKDARCSINCQPLT